MSCFPAGLLFQIQAINQPYILPRVVSTAESLQPEPHCKKGNTTALSSIPGPLHCDFRHRLPFKQNILRQFHGRKQKGPAHRECNAPVLGTAVPQSSPFKRTAGEAWRLASSCCYRKQLPSPLISSNTTDTSPLPRPCILKKQF